MKEVSLFEYGDSDKTKASKLSTALIAISLTEKDETMKDLYNRSALYLKKYSDSICGQGFICHGGEECGSDHK
jgi:hypothetical protein